MSDIILVDDDGSVLLTLAIALRRRGHIVTVACDGQQALNQLARHAYDFLITDIRMPGMSGLELAQRARAAKSAPRILLTSAHYDPTIKPNPAALIAEDFLPKPIDIDLLDTILNRPQSPSRDETRSVSDGRRAKSRLNFSKGILPQQA